MRLYSIRPIREYLIIHFFLRCQFRKMDMYLIFAFITKFARNICLIFNYSDGYFSDLVKLDSSTSLFMIELSLVPLSTICFF